MSKAGTSRITRLIPAVSPAFLIFFSVALILLAVPPPAGAQLGSGSIRGRAPKVIDSGLLSFSGLAVYLYGLRGLRPDETCRFADAAAGAAQPASWPCGQDAVWATSNRIASHWVDCVERGRGPGGEVFATCYLGGVGGPELNAWLVEQGWARAARDYSQDYVAAEEAARKAARGIWRRR